MSAPISVKFPIKVDRSGDIEAKRDPKSGLIPCIECTQCCHYVAIEIDTPEERTEFENVRWYLYHPGIEVYVDQEQTWNVLVHSTCMQLQEDGRCAVYETRPQICRDFSEEECEPNTGEAAEQLLFRTPADFDDWMRLSRTDELLARQEQRHRGKSKRRRRRR